MHTWVLSSGGFLGIGDRLFAIPWNVLTLDTDRECFVLNVSSQRIKDAPGFDKDNWPSMADTAWATSIHEYYGSEPYWGVGAARCAATAGGSAHRSAGRIARSPI